MKNAKSRLTLLFILFVILIIVVYLFYRYLLNLFIQKELVLVEWESTYWAAIIGGVVSGFITLAGVLLTIEYTREQNRKDRELQYRPVFDYQYKYTKRADVEGTLIDYISFISFTRDSNRYNHIFNGLLTFKNVGVGPAIDISIDYSFPDDGLKHIYGWLHAPSAIKSLQSGEIGCIPIEMPFEFETIPKTAFLFDDKGNIYLDESVLMNYKNYKINVVIKYKDLLNNQFEQSIIFKGSFGHTYKSDGGEEGKYTFDLFLDNIEEALII